MGIGRFAFTPMLPLMQAELGLTLPQGGWLAGANYAGYLAGAMASFMLAPRSGAAARWGLAAVAAATLAMGWTQGFALWLLLRFVAGVASAFVLVGVSGWALAQGAKPGWVYAGVGAGIVFAGLLGLLAGAAHLGAAAGWRWLGLAALAVAAAGWSAFGHGAAGGAPAAAAPAAPPPAPAKLDRAAWTLVVAYGVFGLGYIVPATFLPAAARSLVSDPAVFGWAWPLFGAAAFVSTIVAAALAPRLPPRAMAARASWLMVAGVLAPVLSTTLPALLLSALLVGGTFMVVTMAGLQEARRLAGAAPARLMSGMTAAFALGQLAGPFLVRGGRPAAEAIVVPSLVAAALLAAAALALQRRG
ncbi:MAG: YbfB/YjiJ family MFS transporter [Rubrivivax sp.]